MEDLFDGKQKHRCRDQKVGKVKDNPIDLDFIAYKISVTIESVAHLIHEAVVVDPPGSINSTLIAKFVSSTVLLVQTRVVPEGG